MDSQKKKYENPEPMVDEGWWASVLTEENQRIALVQTRLSGGKSEGREDAKIASPERKQIENWDLVKDLYMRDQIIELIVTGHNRGGLLVEGDGMYGFVPFSHLVEMSGKPDIGNREGEFESYVGRMLQVKVIECVPEDGRVVFSERAAQSESGRRAELFHSLLPGQQVQGVITNITDFGVFVDLGGVEGLIHISELSWGRVAHPSNLVKIGETINVQVLELAPERCRVALSLKRLLSNPWQNATLDFPEGCVIPATITSVLSFGAFARLDAGVEGLIHASEIPDAGEKPLKEILNAGQVVNVRILHLDAAHHRMGLSMRLE